MISYGAAPKVCRRRGRGRPGQMRGPRAAPNVHGIATSGKDTLLSLRSVGGLWNGLGGGGGGGAVPWAGISFVQRRQRCAANLLFLFFTLFGVALPCHWPPFILLYSQLVSFQPSPCLVIIRLLPPDYLRNFIITESRPQSRCVFQENYSSLAHFYAVQCLLNVPIAKFKCVL